MGERAALLLLALCALGFAGLGLPDGVLGVAWPSIRTTFALSLDAVGALLVSTTCGYVASSFACGAILARTSLGSLLALSCLLTSLSLCGYAIAPAWLVLVALGFLAGLGAGAIDAGINTFVAKHYSARTLTLLHACYGLGTAGGPLIMTKILMSGATWQSGYVLIAGAQLALALSFVLTSRRWPVSATVGGTAATAPLTATLRLRATWFASATFFLYVGLEATAGVWLYSLLHGARALSMAKAGSAVSLYWGALMAGRLLFAAASARPPSTVLLPCMTGMAAATALLGASGGPFLDTCAIFLLGLAAGPIFPALVATTPQRLDDVHVANAVGFQVAAAALGQALLPAYVGILAQAFGLAVVTHALLGGSVLLLVSYHRLDRTTPVRLDAAQALDAVSFGT